MSKVKVMIEGNNCLIKKGKINEKYGFFSTRIIKIEDLCNFESEAIQVIRGELEGVLLNDIDDPPIFSVEFIEKVEESGVEPVRGFTWYQEVKNITFIEKVLSIFKK